MTSSINVNKHSAKFPRLGNCEVCDKEYAKYTCPKCEVKTCQLLCLNIHKKELNCNGIRDRTKYIPLNKITVNDFMSDYYFLEECTRYINNRKTDKLKQFTQYKRVLPTNLFKLRQAALNREIWLVFLLKNFVKHKTNTTYYDWKLKVILWHIDVVFVNEGETKFVSERFSENKRLIELFEEHVNNKMNTEIFLNSFQTKPISDIRVLLKAEGVKNCKNRFYLLDIEKSLKENLKNKIIIEYPVIYFCYDETINNFDIIENDKDVEEELQNFKQNFNKLTNSNINDSIKSERLINIYDKSEKESNKSKKNSKDKTLVKEYENLTSNFLFTDNHLLDALSSDSDV